MAPDPRALGLVLSAAMTLLVAPPSVAASVPPPNNPFQPGAKPKKTASKKPKRKQTKRRSSRRSGSRSATTRVEVHGRGWGSKSVSTKLGDGPVALAGFDFRFLNGDHKIRGVGLIRDRASVTGQFSDNDGGDPFDFDAWYEKLASARTPPKALASCFHVCDVEIERPQGDEVFVLVGFQVRRTSGDAKFERLAVRARPERGRVRVEFPDGGGNGSTHSARSFEISIQYAYVPRSAVVGQFSTTAKTTRTKNAGTTTAPHGIGRAVLQGFDVRYTGGGRFLENFAIDPRGQSYRLHLRDKSNDDLIGVVLDYVVLKP